MKPIIACDRVHKHYGEVAAVDGVSFEIAKGEIFGLVGPNGAGKTTLIEMIESLRTADSGSICILGLDPAKDPDELLERIGVQLQTTSIQPNIKVREAIELFSSLYRGPGLDPAQLLRLLALENKAHSRYRTLSGGQKQRVAIALAMVNDPEVLFFDELTTGLDPQARSNMWSLVGKLREREKTIFLTTHYMQEAQELCDRVGVIDHGRIIALDTPAGLIGKLGVESKVNFHIAGDDVPAETLQGLSAVQKIEGGVGEYTLYTVNSDRTVVDLVHLADRRGLELSNIQIDTPDLDDVFLSITGRQLRE